MSREAQKRPVYVVITAAGKGMRMGCNIPKQFLSIEGRSILSRTIDRFAPYADEFVLSLSEDAIEFWERVRSEEQELLPPHRVVVGGETRFHSVRSALREVPDGALVAIHDGVRPYVSRRTIECCLASALTAAAAIPVQAVVESLRMLDRNGRSVAVNRSDFVSVQTPQCFLSERIKQAYEQAYSPRFTDDASVYEAFFGQGSVLLVEGNSQNIKITRPVDLLFRPEAGWDC